MNHFSGEFFHTSHSEPGTQILTPAKTLRGEVAAEVVKVAKVAYRYCTFKAQGGQEDVAAEIQALAKVA